jgi:1-acyl-sn-glycerol-3-phosphate acyltransferase
MSALLATAGRAVGVALFLPRVLLLTAAELIAFVVCVVVGWLSKKKIASAAAPESQSQTPPPLSPSLHSVVRWTVGPMCRVLLLAVGFWHIRIRGRRAPASEVRLLVSNHVCIFDGFILTALCGVPSFLARTEGLAQLPIYSDVLRAMQMVFVDRTSKASCRQAADELARRLRSPQAGFPQLVVFPEGTTNDGSARLLPFRKGAFVAGVPCQPVVIR